MKRSYLAVLAALSLGLASCGPTYKTEFDAQCKKDGNSKEDCDAYREYSYRVKMGKSAGEDKYEVNYKVLPLKEVVKNVRQYVDDLKQWLDYQSPDQDLLQYSRTFPALRPWFEQQERIYKSVLALLVADDLHQEFQQLIGDKSSWSYRNDGPGYNPAIFKTSNPLEDFPFKSRVLEEAKSNGIFQPIEHFTVTQDRKFDHKEPDPSDPTDPNKFIWLSKKFSLEVTKYKIMDPTEQPKDNGGNYLEAYRVVDGKRESAPALRAFLDNRQYGYGAIVLVDVDHEGKDIGFGLPDSLVRMSEREVLGERVFALLFPDDDSYKRIETPKPPIRLEIAKVGQPVDPWQAATDAKGWPVPSAYRVEPMGANYNVRLQFKKSKRHEGDNNVNPHEMLREIEYVIKEYTANGDKYKPSSGRVWEYYVPKDPYVKVVKADVRYTEDTKKVRFVFSDGTEDLRYIMPTDNKVIGNKPLMIAHTQGTKRWLLKDENGDGTFEKRQQVSEPKERTGEYSEDYWPAQSYEGNGGYRTREDDPDEEVQPIKPRPF